MVDGRSVILWFGRRPSDTVVRECEARNCTLREGLVSDPTLGADSARAALFTIDPSNEQEMLGLLKSCGATLVDHGLRLDIVTPDDPATGRVQSGLGNAAGGQGFNVRTAPAPPVLAETIARHDPGPIPQRGLVISVAQNREPVRKADEILFRRAFPDCREITLVELGGGRSDARVFAVHKTAISNVGLWPQPAFVKLDRNAKIEREYRNYRRYAASFIPFGLRPNVQDLVVGSERSLLVGDFVDRSESLWELAQRNVAASSITALLEETLGGWRDQGYANNPIAGSVAEAMQSAGICDPSRIKAYYVERAAEEGVHRSAEQLWSVLAGLDQLYRRAPMHGDLHGDNVRVRGGSAILIDLASVCEGPLTADLAGLETWLAFELPDNSPRDRYEDPEWRAVVDGLYAPSAFLHPPGPCRPEKPLAWIGTVVRQIRTMGIAIQSCPTEYQTAVAVQLLRRCQWLNDHPADRYRRAHAYRTAASLVADLEGKAA